jgi:hypothetical protein
MSDRRPDLADAALAAAAAAFDLARIPLGIASRLPGVRLLARDGALVRVRLRSRAEGVVTRVLEAPEARRVVEHISAQVAEALVSANGTPPPRRASRPPAP